VLDCIFENMNEKRSEWKNLKLDIINFYRYNTERLMKEIAILINRLEISWIKDSFYHCLINALHALSMKDIWMNIICHINFLIPISKNAYQKLSIKNKNTSFLKIICQNFSSLNIT
jgi:hypothetical protein